MKITSILTILTIMFTLTLFTILEGNSGSEMGQVLTDGALLKLNAIVLLFLGSFSILRVRDFLLGTKFPIEKINANPLASSIYYGASVFAFVIGIAMIVS